MTPNKPQQLRLPLSGGARPNNAGEACELQLIGPNNLPSDVDFSTLGATISGSIEALSVAVREVGGAVYQNTLASDQVVFILPVQVNLDEFGKTFQNSKGQAKILSLGFYGPRS